MGPRKASEIFLNRHPEAVAFEVILYGSLAATGKGHLTDVAILDTLQPHATVEIVWKTSVFLPFHPNGMTFRSKNRNDRRMDRVQRGRRGFGRRREAFRRDTGIVRNE